MTALDKLIEAVEAGDEDFIRSDDWINAWQEFWPEPDAMRSNGTASTIVALEAYNGSLDAALALHETLLPGQDWCISTSASYAGNGFKASSSTPARAWLLAVLKAYRSIQDDNR